MIGKSSREPITGAVARVISERELAITRGSESGVKPGMIFEVRAKEVLTIIDPDSSEVLGVEDRPKIRVRVERVEPKYSICRTFRVIPGTRSSMDYISSTSLSLLTATDIFGVPDRVETLRAPKEEALPPLSEEDSLVKIGDRVVEVLEDN